MPAGRCEAVLHVSEDSARFPRALDRFHALLQQETARLAHEPRHRRPGRRRAVAVLNEQAGRNTGVRGRIVAKWRLDCLSPGCRAAAGTRLTPDRQALPPS